MKKVIYGSALVVMFVAFYNLGRSIYMPVAHKIKGKETVQSIVSKLESDVHARLKARFESAGYDSEYPRTIVMAAFKEEQTLQVYAVDEARTVLLKEYPFTASSGKLGPKLTEGDKQIPEGVYHVEYLNPNSSYYLSIKVDYPNDFDLSKTMHADKTKMGGDIFIHGKAATIGCIPIGDKAIEEVFLITQKAMQNGVKVIISPWDFRKKPKLPQIEGVDWEEELYSKIKQELSMLDS